MAISREEFGALDDKVEEIYSKLIETQNEARQFADKFVPRLSNLEFDVGNLKKDNEKNKELMDELRTEVDKNTQDMTHMDLDIKEWRKIVEDLESEPQPQSGNASAGAGEPQSEPEGQGIEVKELGEP